MRLLILGGTRFLGRHLVEAALARGAQPTLLNRGRTAPGLFPAVEQLRGDREGDLQVLRGRTWDAVIDTCGYLPRVVRRSAQALRDAVGRYLFVSSISVYADAAASRQDEHAPRAQLPGDDCEDIPNHYGALKAACEDEVQRLFGERAILLRPGLIVGPFDPSGRFTYWVQRVARGGAVLAPPSPAYPVQFIDARDLAAWMLELLHRQRSGAFNASGPAAPLSFGGFLEQCRQALGAPAEFVWPDAAFLERHGVAPWTELPLYAGEGGRGLNEVSLARALSDGLRLRPIGETCVDTARWAGDAPLPEGIGLDGKREAELLRAWQAR
ncbi:MAG: NAD-dependent epimerase/dehydratase family protein [Burkholderiales bacterium]|jgi:2'-hydroxyisoflavone reductase|nr:NAD-dependent epimerase/dehydratase family protein [Burkholderiales bacterium]